MPETPLPDTHLERLLRLTQARGLGGIEPGTTNGSPALTVADTPFVWITAPGIAALACPVDQKVLLMEISPDIFFDTDGHVGEDTILVRMDQIEDDELALKLEDAWRFKAPEGFSR